MASSLKTKVCSHCDDEKSLDLFSSHKTTKDKRRLYCKACAVEINRDWKARNPEWELKYRLQRMYGLDLKAYFALLDRQGNKCAICKSEFGDSRGRRLCVDHDHETGEVRGLLCFNCNTVLGKVKDSSEILRAAITYLEKGD